MDFYINRSVDRRWRSALESDAPRVLFFSPYLTSTTAESVLQRYNTSSAEIYTLFEADLFASGSSSLSTFKNLLQQGHKLFHISQLHAKILLIPGRFVSIGSQNLTRRGTRNREATIVLDNSLEVLEAERLVRPWVEARTPITTQMIADMDELLPPLRRLFRQAQVAAETVDAELRERIAKRKQAARHAQERSWQRAQQLIALQSNLDRAPKSRQVAQGTVRDTSRWNNQKFTYSVVADRGSIFTRWVVEGKQVKLQPRTRYLILNRATGALGWVRLAQGQITFTASNVQRTEPVDMGGRSVLLSFAANRGATPSAETNLTIKINDVFERSLCNVSAWFDTSGVRILNIESSTFEAPNGKQGHTLPCWIQSNESAFINKVLEKLLSPFLFVERLRGEEANVFFGPVGSRFSFRLHLIEGHPVLAFEAL